MSNPSAEHMRKLMNLAEGLNINVGPKPQGGEHPDLMGRGAARQIAIGVVYDDGTLKDRSFLDVNLSELKNKLYDAMMSENPFHEGGSKARWYRNNSQASDQWFQAFQAESDKIVKMVAAKQSEEVRQRGVAAQANAEKAAEAEREKQLRAWQRDNLPRERTARPDHHINSRGAEVGDWET